MTETGEKPLQRVQVAHVPTALLKEFDVAWKDWYGSRSECLRDLMRQFVKHRDRFTE